MLALTIRINKLLTFGCGFQAIDRYGNPVEKGCKFLLDLQGLELQDGQELERKVCNSTLFNSKFGKRYHQWDFAR
jgi:hypothetical protein